MAFERVVRKGGTGRPSGAFVTYSPTASRFYVARGAVDRFGLQPGGVEVLFDPETRRAGLNFSSEQPTLTATFAKGRGLVLTSVDLARRLGLNGASAKFALSRDEETGLLVFGPDPLPAE